MSAPCGQRGFEFIVLERFGEMRVATRPLAAFALREIVARAHRNDEEWQLPQASEFSQQLPAVPARQVNVR